MTFVMIHSTIISQFIADEEQALYGILIGVGIAYGVIMMLIGIMQVHNYTLGKTLLTLLITIIAALIIVFLLLLLSNQLGLVYNFFHSIYTELIFRV
jgi:hypothetical protein